MLKYIKHDIYRETWYKMMFRLIRQVLIASLSFSRPLATKCKYLDNESCMIRHTFIDLDLLNYLLPIHY